MGATGSTLSTDLKGKVIAKHLLDAEILNLMGGSSALPDQIPVEQLMNALKNKTDVFLTHNWGPNQDNHKRVAAVNDALKSKGLLTWFDSEKMEGNVKKKMTQGIDNASCVVVFITQLYIDKVEGENAEDNCQLEFGYASRKKTAKRMVPVVMESGVRNTSGWNGEVGMVLGGLLYVDMCDDLTDAKISELYDRILSVNNGVKLTELFERCMTLTMKHATLPSGANSQQPVNLSAVSSKVSIKGELYDWLTQTVRITPKAAETYCTILTDSNIGSVDRLMKRYEMNKKLLVELNIDELDAEDIVKALVGAVAPTLHPVKPATKNPEPVIVASEKPKQAKTKESISASSHPTVASPSLWSQKASWDVGNRVKVKFSPDGSVIAVAPWDSDILIYDPSGRLITTMKESDKQVTCLSFSPDGTKLAASLNRECVKLFEVSSGRLLWSTTVNPTYQVCFFNSSTLVASEGYESCAIVDVSSGSITSRISANGSIGLCVSNRGTLFTTDGDEVTIWDNLNCQRLSFCSDLWFMCINSDGSLIYVGTDEGDIRVYSDSGLVIGEVKMAHDGCVDSLSMNETSSVLASGGRDNKVKLWNASTLECIQTLEGHSSAVVSVSFAPSNNTLVSGSSDRTVKVWSRC